VGWLDCFARRRSLGRGLVHGARHLAYGEDRDAAASLRPAYQLVPTRAFGMPVGLLPPVLRLFMNAPGMRLVNAVKYRQGALSRHHYRQSHAAFHFLLDYVPGWHRAYGPGGLIQFQSFVPAAAASDTLRTLITCTQAHGIVPYLAVLKRHRADDFLLTHAVDGYSLAMDFKVTAANRQHLWSLCSELATRVVEAGGRFYPAKDSTLDRATYERSLGARLHRFRALKAALDPDDLLQTELSRRLLGHGRTTVRR
jgi:FAD/FMN-containing dehydrogenase